MAKRDKTNVKADGGKAGDVAKPDDQTKLAGLATQIQAGHRMCLESLKGVVAQAKVIGQALIEAKKLVKHGRWLAWVDENCRFAVRMAQNYMLVADHYDAVVARFDTADGWRLTEFIAVARKLEAARRRAARGDGPAKPDPFEGGLEEYARRHQRFQTKAVRKEAERVEAAPAVEEFVRGQLDALYAAVRRFAKSKKAAALTGEAFDAADLGIILLGEVKETLDSAGLFTHTPAVPADPPADKPVNRVKGHLGNGKAHGQLSA
jgi:hypothetical protein